MLVPFLSNAGERGTRAVVPSMQTVQVASDMARGMHTADGGGAINRMRGGRLPCKAYW